MPTVRMNSNRRTRTPPLTRWLLRGALPLPALVVPEPAPALPRTVRLFVAVGTQGQGVTFYKLRCAPGEEARLIREFLADGSYHDWPEPVAGVHQAEATVRAAGRG